MCYTTELQASAQKLQEHFDKEILHPERYSGGVFSGFAHPFLPVITNHNQEFIDFFQWGLKPFWAKDNAIMKNTLNAMIETVNEKPSFKNVVNNRCLVIVTGFFEWKWLDEKGKLKQKYRITLPENEIFTFGGLYSEWKDNATGQKQNTYTIVTTEANSLMSEIHNTKKRMPVILRKGEEKSWLGGKPFEEFMIRDFELSAKLVA